MKLLPYFVIIIIASIYIHFTFYSEPNPQNEIIKNITQDTHNQEIDSVKIDIDSINFDGCGMSFLYQELDKKVNGTAENNYLIINNHIPEDFKPNTFYTFSYNDFLSLDEDNEIRIEQFSVNEDLFFISYCSCFSSGQEPILFKAIDGKIKFSYKKIGEYVLQNVILENFTFQINDNKTFKLKEATFKNVDVSNFPG